MAFHDEQQQQARIGDSEEEYAAYQKISDQYEPEVTGPLVGELQPSTAITAEYASADPVYQAKTAALPQKYSSYRTVRGDGLCGWRAIGFGYLECLIRLGDSNKFGEEEARLRSLSNLLVAADFQLWMLDEHFDITFGLFRRLTAAMNEGKADQVLLEAFNDEEIQNYVISYLKTLTAAWMKTHAQDYEPFLIGQTLEQYCNVQIMPTVTEIEHIGLTALNDVLLSPAGVILEIIYLDRSEGSEVNMHTFPFNSPGSFELGTIKLLYRPGHYDLLYMPEDLPPPPIQTYLQYGSEENEPIEDLGVSDVIFNIPGMSLANPQSGWISGGSFDGSDFFSTPAAHPHATHSVPTPVAPAPQPHMQPHTLSVYVPPTPQQMGAPPSQMPQEMAIRSAPPLSIPGNVVLPHPFRPSSYQFDLQLPLTTPPFKQSPFNTAHFQNRNFQPEQWRPEDDYEVSAHSGRPARHRNSG